MKKWLAPIIAAALLLTFSACGDDKKTAKNNDSDKSASQDKQTVLTEDVEIPSDENNTDDKNNQDEQNQETLKYINPLTGLESERDVANVRPVAIMLNNLYQALPQVGISEAEVLYETLEEGGITRLLGVYNDFEIMNEIGSIRSARDYYIDIADAHDAVFVHAGRSTYADTALRTRGTNNVDGLYQSSFYRSAERRQTMAVEHTLMNTGEGIYNDIINLGYRTTSEKPSPLEFSSSYAKGTAAAQHIEIPFSIGYTSNPYVTAVLDYNEQSTEYLKSQFGQAHIDGDDGSQLSFKNVITLTCPMNLIAGDPLGCIQVHFTGSGNGTYSVDGTTREIKWEKQSRSSAYTLYEADGTPLLLAPGKSYVAIVSTGTQIKTN